MHVAYLCIELVLFLALRCANNESSEVIDILLPATFYFKPSTRPNNVTNL